MRTTLIGILLCLVFVRQALPQVRQPASQLDLMPMPRSVQLGIGRLVVTSSFSIAIDGYKNELLERAAQRLFLELSRQTGISMSGQLVDRDKATLVIHADHASKPIQELGEDESYTLDVTTNRAKLAAPNPLGVLRGLGDASTTRGNHASCIFGARGSHRRPTAISLARVDDRCEPPFHPIRGAAAQRRRHGSGEIKRSALASVRRPRIPSREQEISKAARDGLRQSLLHPE